jgi:hypothetical protein
MCSGNHGVCLNLPYGLLVRPIFLRRNRYDRFGRQAAVDMREC